MDGTPFPRHPASGDDPAETRCRIAAAFHSAMLASAEQELPQGDDWSYEMKWDGARATAMLGPNAVELRSRAGNEITLGYPELQPLAHSLGTTTAVLDGEIVARIAPQVPVIEPPSASPRLPGRRVDKHPRDVHRE